MLPEPLQNTSLRLLLLTVLGLLTMMLAGALLVSGLALHYGLTLGTADAVYASVAERQQLRLLLLFNNLFVFGLSALFALYGTYKNWWTVAAGLVSPKNREAITVAIVTFLLGLPLISLAAYLNLQLDLPTWMIQSEADSNALLAGVLSFDAVPELLMALLTVAIVPGFCEELMFRGILQRRLLSAIMPDHVAVWVAAAVFSAIHIEFAGFFPRLLLGALLGYSYRWTGSLWIPIIIHILFNGIQVVVSYYTGFSPDTEMDEDARSVVIYGAISLVATVGLVIYAEQRYSR